MPRAPGVQLIRRRRQDGSTTYALRVRIRGIDARISLGNSGDGWDEVRADHARRQLLAKIELGQWAPPIDARRGSSSTEPTLRELATDWLEARRRDPAIRPRTISFNEIQLKRYLAPFFGELRPSEITVATIKGYRDRIHMENEQIRRAEQSGVPLRDPRTNHRLRTLSNDSINQSIRTLALILDDAEDSGWIERNPARAKRARVPGDRHANRGALDIDEFLDVLDAGTQLDGQHRPGTLERAVIIRGLRDDAGMEWKAIAQRVGVSPTNAIYLYGCADDRGAELWSPRRAVIATLGLTGVRVGELCQLDTQDINLTKSRLYISDAKTAAGVRSVDIHPRLRAELERYLRGRPPLAGDAPAFPTRAGTRRTRSNVLTHVIRPAVQRANELRADRGDPPIRAHVTPHTFRRSYISYMVAAGNDLPYIQAQVGHRDPTTTLAIYAQVIARSDRDQLRAEIRDLMGVERPAEAPSAEQAATRVRRRDPRHQLRVTSAEKARKGPTPRR